MGRFVVNVWQRLNWVALTWLTLALVAGTFSSGLALAEESQAVPSDALQAFQNLWQRNDRPVAEGRASRTWTWGPSSFKVLSEPYAEATGGQRSVVYYDKSRMEINNPGADKNSQWYVTNGLIVKEMVSGRIQIGDSAYQNIAPAQVAVAGDPIASNPNAPTYATFTNLASLNSDHRASQKPVSSIIDRINHNGAISQDGSLAGYNVRYAYYEPTLGHNIPDVFMNFFNNQGLIYDKGNYHTTQVLDWVFASGLPITEPYWANVKIAGKDATVLVQLFERRVLTYNPANALEWRVEMGNVGQHYYTWRYSSAAPAPAANPAPDPLDTSPAFGTVEESGAQQVLEIGNGSVKRTVIMSNGGGIYTSSILNRLTETEYLAKPRSEFTLTFSHELAGDPTQQNVTSDNAVVTGYRWIAQSNEHQLIEIQLNSSFEGTPFSVLLYYEALGGQNFVRKWLVVPPFNGQGWAVVKSTLEDWQPDENLGPLTPSSRYSAVYADGQTDLNAPDSVITANPDNRYESAERSNAVAMHRNGQEGFYFFQESLFGQENFSHSEGLTLSNADFVEPSQGFTSGRSVIGMWRGPAEVGFKRYRDYIYNQYAAVRGKPDPVWFSTWYVYEGGINQETLSGVVDRMKAAGFYNLLHVDAGWEGSDPLQVDQEKFPQGLDPIIGKLNADGMGLGLWINPFTHAYEGVVNHSAFRQEHPDWVSPDGQRLCPLSGAGDYVQSRLLEITQNWPLDELYWDGAEWNPNSCESSDRRWRTQNEERILTLRYFANLSQQLHAIRPNLRIILFSMPPDVHWLSAVDQIQFSDIAEPPLLQSELTRRQQAYYTGFEYPYAGTWGDWYGINYKRDYSQGLGAPLNLLEYAEVSMLGNNANQAGASFDLSIAPSALLDFLKQMYGFRSRFSSYFATYQHVLNFPNGNNVDGEAHIIQGQGFILLFNPTASNLTVNLPLDEPELELRPEVGYNLSDWSNFSGGQFLGTFKPDQRPALTVPAYGYKIIGVNIAA